MGEENNNWTANKHITVSCSSASRGGTETNVSQNGQAQTQDVIDLQNHSGGLNRTGNKPQLNGNPKSLISTDNISTYNTEEISLENNDSGTSSWDDWERSVVVEGNVDEEDIDDFAFVEDNDDIHDVVVQQYINGLHDEQRQKNGTADRTDRKDVKITPTRVQQISKLKSTTNADSARHPPGTMPTPPKGIDRWGGSELKGVEEPTGWGDIDEGSQNWYNDGVALWDRTCANSEVGNSTNGDTNANGKSVEVQQSSTVPLKPSTTFNSGKVGEMKTQTVVKTHKPHIPNSSKLPLQQGRSKGLGRTPDWGTSRSSRTFGKSSGTSALRRPEKHLETKLHNGQEEEKKILTTSPTSWGKSVQQNPVEPSGWGDTDNFSKNWYDDGSSLWDTPTSKDNATTGEWK